MKVLTFGQTYQVNSGAGAEALKTLFQRANIASDSHYESALSSAFVYTGPEIDTFSQLKTLKTETETAYNLAKDTPKPENFADLEDIDAYYDGLKISQDAYTNALSQLQSFTLSQAKNALPLNYDPSTQKLNLALPDLTEIQTVLNLQA